LFEVDKFRTFIFREKIDKNKKAHFFRSRPIY